MKRVKDKTGRFAKKMMAFLMCTAVLVSAPTGFSSVKASEVAATESTQVETTTTSTSKETTNIDPNGTLGKNSDVGIEVTKSITGAAGKNVKVEFKLKSNDTTNIKLKSVYPVIDTMFPFETSGDAYKVISAGDDAEKQSNLSASFEMKTRSDITTGYQSVKFIGEYTKIASDGTAADYYVIKTINIYFTSGSTSGNSSGGSSSGSSGSKSSSGSSSSSKSDSDDDDDDDDSSYYSGGGSDASDEEVTAPKLVITGYDTEPEKIMAGETFKLTIHVQNTSKTTSVCNGKFLIGNEAGNFLPTSGSSAVYVESIPAGKTGDIEIELKTAADLAQKNYILVVKGDFDDGKGNMFTSSDNLSVPVYQEVKLGITDITMTPEAIGIDSEGSLMFTINNQGSAGVYNVNVSVKDDAVSCEDSYVGNIAASSSAYATLNVTGVADNSDKGTIKVVISYEDSEGNTGELEQEVDCLVSDEAAMELDEDMDMLEDEYEETGINWILVAIIALVVIVVIVVAVILIMKRRKKRAAELLDDEDDDEDGEDEIDHEDF